MRGESYFGVMPAPLNLIDLGRRIRTARMALRLTLEEVVSRTDFTVSWLSKIENGLLAPSLEGLVRLAEVLECSVEHLVAGLSVPPRAVVDRKDGGRPSAGREPRGLAVVRLAEEWRGRAMEPALLHVSTNGARKGPDQHDGERFLHVIEGEVRLAYGEELIVLGPGDSIYIDASLPHTLAPATRASARVLSVSFHPTRNGHHAEKPHPDGQARRPPVTAPAGKAPPAPRGRRG